MKVGRQVTMLLYLRPNQKRALATLSKHLDVPTQALLRDAIDAFLVARLPGFDPVTAKPVMRPDRRRTAVKGVRRGHR